MNVPNLAFLPAAIDACALYRMYIPHLSIPNARFIYDPTKVPFELLQYQKIRVVAVQRLFSASNIRAIELLHQHKFKVIYDLDDNIWSIPHYNPAKHIIGQVNQVDGFTNCAKLADLITVSTPQLKSAVSQTVPQMADRIRVCPNAMDFRWFKDHQISRADDRVVIGWAGSNTHDEDMKIIFRVLIKMLDKYPHVYVEFSGGGGYITSKMQGIAVPKEFLPKELATHPKVKIRPWVPVSEYPAAISSWGWDIALAPLEDNRFNRSKSNIRLLEAAAVGMVCLASDVGPYADFYNKYDSDLAWLLCRLSSDWETKLDGLVRLSTLRQSLSQKMLKVAQHHFDIADLKHNWINAVREVCTM